MPRKPDPSLSVKEHFARLVHELYSLGDGIDSRALTPSGRRGFTLATKILLWSGFFEPPTSTLVR